MTPIFSVVVAFLALVEANVLPRLDESFCGSDAVVIASVEQIAESESSSDPAYIRLRVAGWIKGELRAPGCFVVKGNLRYQTGKSYLMFLTIAPDAAAAYRTVRQSDSCSAEVALPMLGSVLWKPMTVDERGMVELDPGYVVLPTDLLSTEDALSLRDQDRPAWLRLDAVERHLSRLSETGCADPEKPGGV